MKRSALLMVILLCFGCSHPSGSKIGKGSNPTQRTPEQQESLFVEKADEDSTSDWDRVLDDIGFLIRWLDGDTIIFP